MTPCLTLRVFSTPQRLNEKAARDEAQSKKLADARAEAAKKVEELKQAKLAAQVCIPTQAVLLLCRNAVFCSRELKHRLTVLHLTFVFTLELDQQKREAEWAAKATAAAQASSAQLADLRTSLETELSAKLTAAKEHQAALATSQLTALKAAHETELRARLTAAEAQQQQQLAAAGDAASVQLASVKADLSARMASAADAADASSARLVAAKESFAAELAALKAQHEQQLESTSETASTQLAAALASAKASYDAQGDELVTVREANAQLMATSTAKDVSILQHTSSFSTYLCCS